MATPFLLAVVLSFAALASAAPNADRSSNLVRNGGAEIGAGAPDDQHAVVPPGWEVTSKFTEIRYGASGGFPDPSAARAIGGGRQFFAGGTDNPRSTAVQTVSIPASWIRRIDRKHVSATLSADLGGFSGQRDQATVRASFLGRNSEALGSIHVGPVASAGRGSATKLVPRTKTGPVPAGTRSVKILITAARFDGSYNDGYADNVSLVLTGSKAPGT
jgi:hypothetical protein